jgi:hypothetical protein
MQRASWLFRIWIVLWYLLTSGVAILIAVHWFAGTSHPLLASELARRVALFILFMGLVFVNLGVEPWLRAGAARVERRLRGERPRPPQPVNGHRPHDTPPIVRR